MAGKAKAGVVHTIRGETHWWQVKVCMLAFVITLPHKEVLHQVSSTLTFCLLEA